MSTLGPEVDFNHSASFMDP